VLNQNFNSLVHQGIKCLESGNLVAASQMFNSASKLNKKHPHLIYLLGVVAWKQGNRSEGLKLLRKAIKVESKVSIYHRDLGLALIESKQNSDAVGPLKKALLLDEDDVNTRQKLAATYVQLNKISEAISEYKRIINKQPNRADAYSNLGEMLSRKGQAEAAVENFEKAIQLDPNYAAAYANLGNVQLYQGEIEKAVLSYDKAIDLKPDLALAYVNRGHALGKYSADDTKIAIMESFVESKAISEADRKLFSFALAKAHEDLGQTDRSFSFLEKGNQIQKQELSYNIESDRRLISSLKELFGPNRQVTGYQGEISSSKKPIFIVGMLRSGTSLVEQILASHSEVFGAGELESMTDFASPLLEKSIGQSNSSAKFALSKNEIKVIREKYLDALAELGVSESAVTDKMPYNFLWLGFILSAFPEAKIIHVNRDARATCWSIFKHYIANRRVGYAHDQEDLSEYYKLYKDLMVFWSELFPGKIYELDYEKLTENQEEETKKLLAACGLDWQDQCLDFHTTSRSVRTLSMMQVRKKMYKGSSDDWRKYEDRLRPLLQGLGY
jgi:Tfp pilus assembly protein PilF